MQLHEIINLYYELNGVTKQTKEGDEVISKGLLKQSMSLKNKVYLQRLNKVVSDEVKIYEEAKKELFDKYVVQEDGQYIVPADKVEDYNKEHFDLLTAQREISVAALWGSDLTLESIASIETDEFYPQLFALIDDKK